MHHRIIVPLFMTLCGTYQLSALQKFTPMSTYKLPVMPHKVHLDERYKKAIKQNDSAELTRLLTLETKPNVNALYDVTLKDKPQHMTMLMLAAYLRRSEATDVLLQYGALADIKNSAGMTALMYAVGPSHEQTTYGKYTISDVEEEVAEQGEQIAQQLLKANADVNAQDNKGKTALMHVAPHPRSALAEVLLEHGASVNTRDKNEFSAVMHAAHHASIEMTLMLLYKAKAFCAQSDIAMIDTGRFDRAKRVTIDCLLDRYQTWIEAHPSLDALPYEATKFYLDQYEREEKQALEDFETGSSRKIKRSSHRSSDAQSNSEEKKQENKQPVANPVAAEKGSSSWCIIS